MSILTAYKNALLRNVPSVEQEAARRLTICRKCPLRKITAGVERCGQCGCPLAALTRQNGKICTKWK